MQRFHIEHEDSCCRRAARVSRGAGRLVKMLLVMLGAALALPAAAQTHSAQGAPRVVGVKTVPRGLNMCNDYASPRDYSGSPYRVVEPDRIVTRHEGIDFCARAGAEVIAPVDGTISFAVPHHPARGGQVLIKTRFRTKAGARGARPVYVGLVHMKPLAGLRAGARVKAGQVVGHVNRAGAVEIGSRAHVHMTARICSDTHKCHFDPNHLWRDGPGRISCFVPGQTLPLGKIVAPFPCRN